MPLAIGQVVQNRYRIHRLLGEGGMGAVYLAEDGRLPGRWCAIKESRPDAQASPQALAALRAQFHNEASTLARLSHPNLPTVSDYFGEGGSEYLVMDYVAGEDLAAVLARQRGPLPEAQVLTWAAQVLAALEYLHNQRPKPVIHRDIKPSNLVLTAGGQVKLVDFGLVKLLDPSDPRTATVLEGVGTPEYAPIEQYAAGSGHTGPWSDIYSLGATLYHLLTDRKPVEVHQRVVNPEALIPPRRLNGQLTPHVEAAILKAMALRPEERFRSAAEMRAALASAPIGGKATMPMTSRRHGPASGAYLASSLVLVAALLLGSYWLIRSAEGPRSLGPAPVADVPASTALVTGDSGGQEPLPTVPAFSVTTAAPIVSTLEPRLDSPLPTLPEPIPTANSRTEPAAGTSLVAYTSGRTGNWRIVLGDPATGQNRLLPGQPPNSGVAAFSPDGQRMAFRSDDSGQWQIYTINIDGSELRQLTSDNGNNLEAVWSQDGSRIAFVSDRDGNKEIYQMNSDGANQRRLTANPGWDDDPSWSPDRNWLVFESQRDGRIDLYKMRPDGSNVVRLTTGGDLNSTPAWSPMGKFIAFERKQAAVYHIWVMNEDGSGARQVTMAGKLNLRPAWSPDGSEIAYTSDREGEDAIWIEPLDRSGPARRLSPGEGFDAAWSGY